ncbi:MAG: cell filamentation protein Fic, partial [Rikenellaceae bacterium]
MATKAELLAASLEALKEIQNREDFLIVRSAELSRTHLKRLIDNRFLSQIIAGWYVVTDPLSLPGDTTAWYASFWKFISLYANDRYGDDWSLSAEQSLSIYSGLTIVSKQVVIRSKSANNNVIELIGGNSALSLKADIPNNTTKQNGLNLYSLEEALIVCAPSMYQLEPLTMRTALSMIKDSSVILKILVDTGQTTRAGRLVGAFRNIGRADIAHDILSTMKRMGYDVREDDPFEESIEVSFSPSPYATRIRLMWQKMRDVVVNNFTLTKSSLSKPEILAQMEAKY